MRQRAEQAEQLRANAENARAEAESEAQRTGNLLAEASERRRDAQQKADEAEKRFVEVAGHERQADEQVKLIDRYNGLAVETIKRHQTMSTRTNVSGHFEARELPIGKYRVHTVQPIPDGQVRWIFPLEVKAEPQKLDLTNANASWPITPAATK